MAVIRLTDSPSGSGSGSVAGSSGTIGLAYTWL